MSDVDAQELGAFTARLDLRYVADDEPGIKRVRRGRGWSFHDDAGQLLDGADRDRCVALVIPPAWEDVWICATADGHVQARGSDDAARTQYRYHDTWIHARRCRNFDRLRQIGPRLGPLRRRLDELLQDGRDERRRVAAAMVRLVDVGMARIGGTRSATQYGHFGVSTLRADHVEVDGDHITLSYPGKSGVERHIEVDDAVLADVVAELDTARDALFGVVDESGQIQLDASDANQLLAEESPAYRITCKDFRTWGASAVALQAMVEGATEVEAVDAAAEKLGNTRAVARGSYVHPHVTSASEEEVELAWAGSRSSSRYDRREQALLKLLAALPPLMDQWPERSATR